MNLKMTKAFIVTTLVGLPVFAGAHMMEQKIAYIDPDCNTYEVRALAFGNEADPMYYRAAPFLTEFTAQDLKKLDMSVRIDRDRNVLLVSGSNEIKNLGTIDLKKVKEWCEYKIQYLWPADQEHNWTDFSVNPKLKVETNIDFLEGCQWSPAAGNLPRQKRASVLETNIKEQDRPSVLRMSFNFDTYYFNERRCGGNENPIYGDVFGNKSNLRRTVTAE